MLPQNSFTKRTAEAKKNAAIAALTMVLAKEANDPVYKRANGFKKKFLQFKAMVVRKYLPQAKSLYFKKKSGSSESDSNTHTK
jgi:hypothetical protein